MTRAVGYIGLGNIGGAMAVRLATNDHQLLVIHTRINNPRSENFRPELR